MNLIKNLNFNYGTVAAFSALLFYFLDFSDIMVLKWPWIVTGALTSYIAYVNMPVRWMKLPRKATLEWLSETQLESLSTPSKTVKAKELWEQNGGLIMAVRRPGCLLCRDEAQHLSKLSSCLETKKVPMYAVLHERRGADAFQQFFKGELYFDREKKFFGPEERRMGLSGMLRFTVWKNAWDSYKDGVHGNMKGDGTLLGGVFLIGPGDTGILYEHQEMEFGDSFNEAELCAAIEQIKQATATTAK